MSVSERVSEKKASERTKKSLRVGNSQWDGGGASHDDAHKARYWHYSPDDATDQGQDLTHPKEHLSPAPQAHSIQPRHWAHTHVSTRPHVNKSTCPCVCEGESEALKSGNSANDARSHPPSLISAFCQTDASWRVETLLSAGSTLAFPPFFRRRALPFASIAASSFPGGVH